MPSGYKQLSDAWKLVNFSFEGRLNFTEYSFAQIWVVIFAMSAVLAGMLVMIIGGLGHKALIAGGVACGIGLLACLVANAAITVRRLRDAGRSPHWIWLWFTGIGAVVPYILTFGDSVEDNSKPAFNDIKEAFRNVIPKSMGRLNYKQFSMSSTIINTITSFISIFSMWHFSVTVMPKLVEFINHFYLQRGVYANEFYQNQHFNDMLLSLVMYSISPLSSLFNIISTASTVLLAILVVRRLHDTGRSGLNLLWVLAFGIGIVVPLCMIFADTDVDNRYGKAES